MKILFGFEPKTLFLAQTISSHNVSLKKQLFLKAHMNCPCPWAQIFVSGT
jgi:hypothetical protein